MELLDLQGMLLDLQGMLLLPGGLTGGQEPGTAWHLGFIRAAWAPSCCWMSLGLFVLGEGPTAGKGE